MTRCLRAVTGYSGTRRTHVNLRRIFLRKQPLRPSTTLSEAERKEDSKESDEEPKSWRENPTLKYWVLGSLGISGSVYYYVYRNHEKKRLLVKHLPSTPSHFVLSRERDLSALFSLHSQLKGRESLTVLHIVGCPGSGKTELAREFAEKLSREEQERYTFLPGNLFFGTLNGSSVESLFFDVKRFAISVGCFESDWTSKAGEGVNFSSLSKKEQLDCLVDAVREKLKNSQGWILILENVKDNEAMYRWFSANSSKNWGNGTVLLTRDGHVNSDAVINNTYSIDEG